MVSGSCLCGDIVYEYTGEPTTTALCHCQDCKKWTGAAFTANVIVPKSALTVTKGTPKEFDIVAASGKVNRRTFCARCGSSLFSQPEVMGDLIAIKSGCLDGGADDHAIQVEYYNKTRLGYTKPVDGADQKVAFP